MLQINAGSVKYRGQYECTVVRASGKVDHYGRFDNLLLNTFFTSNKIDLDTTGLSLAIGTGTTPPVVTDTALEAEINVGTVPPVAISGGSGPGDGGIGCKINRKISATYDVGAVVGNVTEFGLKHDSGLVSRSLIKDANGDVIVGGISVGSLDQLTLSYWMTATVAPVDATFSAVDLEGVPTDIRMRNFALNGGSGVLSGIGWDQVYLLHSAAGSKQYVGTSGNLTPPSSQQDKLPVIVPTDDFNAPLSQVSINTVNIDNDSYKVVYSANYLTAQMNVNAIKYLGMTGNTSTARWDFCSVLLDFAPAFDKTADKTLAYTFSYTITRG